MLASAPLLEAFATLQFLTIMASEVRIARSRGDGYGALSACVLDGNFNHPAERTGVVFE